ncbi:endo alpha-1,4 polygalactosaminidase [Nitrosomonas communis]|uniref:endo alpha-1,4 polygalactosaminidase n=1 Tax=Nitrosomonas communis TaxID=44574 RepID=UPI0026EECE1E|nr:endo alpha-1,4 polygalactosaminidase [Nitrosomonas communis]MCO6426841.1 endo alpha-1,4 polygalactosaminidase [Nitrosomonas communis]
MTEPEMIQASNIPPINSKINSTRRFSAHKICQPQKVKSLIQLLLTMLLLIANISFAEFISPSSLLNKRGSSSPQPLDTVTVKDQQGTDDNWNNYIEFEPGSQGYQGIFKFNLPASPNKAISELIFHANYRGPEKSIQKWEFQLLNSSGNWISIADNHNIVDWVWSDIISVIKEPGQFINNKNQITLRYRTSSHVDHSQLDYLAFEISNLESNSPEVGHNTSELDDVITVTPSPTAGTRWQPTPGLKWQIQYHDSLDTSLNVDVYNIDLFDTSATAISALQSKGKYVICYFSAGSYENWRPDTGAFPASVLGRNLDGWAGEKWLDIRQLDILIPIMQVRMKLAAKKGCNGVDPDNVDGYSNNTGFPLSYNNQLAYNIALAEAAHDLGLAIGLKNDVDQIKDLVNYFDFAVNEECFQYGECNTLKPFINAGKAVFGIEYNLSNSSFCPQANLMNFDFLKKKLSLDAWRESCR